MKKIKFLEQSRWLMVMIVMCLMGTSNVWAVDPPTLSDLSFGTPIIDENFNNVSKVSRTTIVNPAGNLSGYGVFDKIYNNSTLNTYAVEDETFATNSLKLTQGSGSALVLGVSGQTFGSSGAFRFTTTTSSYCYVGICADAPNSNAYTKANASVFIRNSAGTLSISRNTSSNWQDIGTFTSTDEIDICVIYNQTSSATTYGNSISLASHRAHVYVNGTCVNTNGTPTAFVLSEISLTYFRVSAVPTNGYSAYIDDIKVWDELPTQGSLHVTYDGNGKTGGTVPTDNTDYSSGNTVTVKANTGSLVRTGCTFSGWNTAADGSGTSYAAGATFTISANTTLYAKWAATVKWHDNSGVIQTDNIFVPAAGKSVTPPSDPSTSEPNCGDKFMGWTKTEDYKDDDDAPGDLVNGAQTVTGSADYYAVFADKKPVTP